MLRPYGHGVRTAAGARRRRARTGHDHRRHDAVWGTAPPCPDTVPCLPLARIAREERRHDRSLAATNSLPASRLIRRLKQFQRTLLAFGAGGSAGVAERAAEVAVDDRHAGERWGNGGRWRRWGRARRRGRQRGRGRRGGRWPAAGEFPGPNPDGAGAVSGDAQPAVLGGEGGVGAAGFQRAHDDTLGGGEGDDGAGQDVAGRGRGGRRGRVRGAGQCHGFRARPGRPEAAAEQEAGQGDGQDEPGMAARASRGGRCARAKHAEGRGRVGMAGGRGRGRSCGGRGVGARRRVTGGGSGVRWRRRVAVAKQGADDDAAIGPAGGNIAHVRRSFRGWPRRSGRRGR
ncbi:hypothetical protein [Candidatus Chloroploca asiatica]|uniref:hypothetical protein n=1 Tax=Candidatus Chloroploca asiatica TaxID=1506545 RepID=UPI00114263E8|nr:hypothetical protein [Candidatus Chloroploca asiatica]